MKADADYIAVKKKTKEDRERTARALLEVDHMVDMDQLSRRR